MGVNQLKVLTTACLVMSGCGSGHGLLIKLEKALGFVFGVIAQTEMKIWCVYAESSVNFNNIQDDVESPTICVQACQGLSKLA